MASIGSNAFSILSSSEEHISADAQKFLLVKSGNQTLKINQDEIIYLESKNDLVMIHTQQEQFKTHTSLTSLFEHLDIKSFIQIHRLYVVNAKAIRAFSASEVMVCESHLPIGRNYRSRSFKVVKCKLIRQVS